MSEQSSDRVFIVVTVSEDGADLERVFHDELLKRLNNKYYDNFEAITSKDLDNGHCSDLTERAGVYIIDGDLVEPKAKTRVTEWTL